MTASDRVYFAVACHLDQRERVLLWYSDDTDGLVVDGQGGLVTFEDIDAAISYASAEGFEVKSWSLVHDIDQLQSWVSKTEQSSATLDCCKFLNCWNLFTDVAASLEQGSARGSQFMIEAFRREDRDASSIYDKLFLGNNLPAMTPPGSHYEPVWANYELAQLRRVLAAGVRLLRAALTAPAR